MKLLYLMLFVCAVNICNAQKPVAPADRAAIRNTIVHFLKWHKNFEADTSRRPYQITKGGYPDTTTGVRIDFEGLEQYLNEYLKTQLVSETFINNLRLYFRDIDKNLALMPIQNGLQKIDGLDIDPVLKTYDTDEITDHIDQSKITQLHIIYNKALVSVHFSTYTDMLFTLTREQKHWKIDYAGADGTGKYSLFRQ
jgi:hypothetical protein